MWYKTRIQINEGDICCIMSNVDFKPKLFGLDDNLVIINSIKYNSIYNMKYYRVCEVNTGIEYTVADSEVICKIDFNPTFKTIDTSKRKSIWKDIRFSGFNGWGVRDQFWVYF